jgi:hypothetical protein
MELNASIEPWRGAWASLRVTVSAVAMFAV